MTACKSSVMYCRMIVLIRLSVENAFTPYLSIPFNRIFLNPSPDDNNNISILHGWKIALRTEQNWFAGLRRETDIYHTARAAEQTE